MSEMNYSSIYSIKEFAINELAPKYFDMANINELNIGLLGYTTEMIANTSEDSFNTVSMLMNEMFPNLAVLPESIYNYAALFQMDKIFAIASGLDMMLFITEQDILNNATRVKSNGTGTQDEDLYEFFLDSDTIIDVEGIQFLPDYDIRINYKPYRNDYIFTASYNMKKYNTLFNNTISSVKNPYIRIKRMTVDHQKYVVLMIKTHQVNKFTLNETILNNDVVNLPTYTIDFEDSLSNFEVFYRAPGDETFIQLKKRMDGTTPLKEPFCFYKFKNDNQLEISFSSRDNYFQPKFNAELNIDYTISLGKKGDFPLYKGNNIIVQPSSQVYDYNNNIVLFAIPQSESTGGADKMTFEQLKNTVVEKFSTVESYTNENDLQLYFSNFNLRFNSNILFIKKRDDVFQRLFTSFTLFKNTNNDIFHTNTLHIDMTTDQFDIEYSQSDAYILKPGHLFTYKQGMNDTVEVRDGMITSMGNLTAPFIYTNPFLLYFVKDPTVLGYYLNTTDAKYVVDYVDVNNNSLVQFICNSLAVKRYAISGEDYYTVSITVTPTSELDNPIVSEVKDEVTGETKPVFSNSLIIRMAIEDSGNETAFCDFHLKEWNLTDQLYTYECKIKTDDYITLTNKIRVLDMFSIDSTPEDYDKTPKLIPMFDCKINIYTWYKYKDTSVEILAVDPEAPISIANYVKTNTYSTDTNKVTFMYPVQMIRSRTKFVYNGDGTLLDDGRIEGGTYNLSINSCPFVEATTMLNKDLSNEFYKYLSSQYNYISDILDTITNNYSVDMKFYNTYGKSKNFRVGDDGESLLDRVNISLHIKIKPIFGASVEDLVRDLKIYIKKYIESINDGGTNSFFVSNLIQSIENDFPDVKYLKFVNINGMPTSIQVIENKTVNLETLTKEERMNYVPEYLTIQLEDVIVDVI